jgi:hypothetical protein
MSDDRPSLQDPTSTHTQPDTEGEQLPAPGHDESVTGSMREEPDHGEETYRGTGRLKDRVAVLTGGDSGIGRAVAVAFAREGADLLISYLPGEDDDAKETARLVEEAGRTAVLLAGDLTSEETCQQVVDRAVSEFGRIDILVNNAAYQMAQPGGIEDITTEQFDRVRDVLDLQKGAPAHAEGIGHHQHLVGTGVIAVPRATGLCHHQGGHRELHSRPGIVGRRARDPGELGSAGSHLDAAHSGHHAPGAGGELRRADPSRPGRTARGAGARLRVPCLPGVQLHHRRGAGRHRRSAGVRRVPGIKAPAGDGSPAAGAVPARPPGVSFEERS